jgi:hypothetical protein
MGKSAPITMRLNDNVKEIVDRQPGENFTDKFERLVIELDARMEYKKQELRSFENRIEQKRKEFLRLSERASIMNGIVNDLNSLSNEVIRVKIACDQFIKGSNDDE